MKDIDFDELDKAVNSLMGGVKSTSEDSSQKTLAISTTLKEGEEPAYDKLRRVAEKIGSETIQQPNETTEIIPDSAPQTAPVEITPAPATVAPEPVSLPSSSPEPKQKASGRFMDVMHPSSDMTTPGSGSSEAKPVPAPAPTAPVIAVPTREPKKTPIVPISAPDPEPVPVVMPVEVPAGPATIETPPEPSAPLTSPFLPDPKVEKRPLGGQPAPEEKELSSGFDISSLEAPLKSDTSTDAQVTPDATNPDLPLELHSDLLEIEKNAAELIPDEPEDEPESVPQEPIKLDVVAPAPKEAAQQSVTESAPVPAALETSASDEDHPSDGAIFDTSQYHTPVAHPAKHGREWLWIVVIIVIVLISAAGGAAFYLLGA